MSKSKKRVNITVTEELKNFYVKKSKDIGVSMSSLMNIALKEYMDNCLKN